MPDKVVKRNNITLSDYNYRRDLENRVLMAELSVFEVDVLREILDSSLKFPIKQLAATFKVKEKDILPVLDKLVPSKLVKYDKENVHVDKEMRKYYESQILKFDDDFQPDVEFLLGLLSKVPIHVLPTWYAIPNSPTTIYNAIIENYLLTPKIYEFYLHELKFKDPVLTSIMHELFATKELKLCAKYLIKKHNLSREQFENYMLYLEYSFVCCLGYQQDGDMWEEIVIPFYEWRVYLETERETIPKSIAKIEDIQFEPVNDKRSNFEVLHNAYRDVMGRLRKKFIDLDYGDRDIREVERALSRVMDIGWVYLDDFLVDFASPIGKVPSITLVNKGKKWRYARPVYSQADYDFIKTILIDGLANSGVIELGKKGTKKCFRVTKFGRSHITG